MRRKKRVYKLVRIHLCVLIAGLFLVFVYKCPLNYFLHIPCPGCGITRACLAALRLDFAAAFSYHPLFFTVAPAIAYAAHRSLLKRKPSGRVELICYGTLAAAFLAVYIFRMIWGDYSQG